MIEGVVWSLTSCSFIRIRGVLWPTPTWYRRKAATRQIQTQVALTRRKCLEAGMALDWAVTVERRGERILTIEPGCVAGRDLSPDDEESIRTAARHLLAFIGDPAPPEPAVDLTPDITLNRLIAEHD